MANITKFKIKSKKNIRLSEFDKLPRDCCGYDSKITCRDCFKTATVTSVKVVSDNYFVVRYVCGMGHTIKRVYQRVPQEKIN